MQADRGFESHPLRHFEVKIKLKHPERLIEVDITRTVTEVLGTLSYDKVDRVLSWNGNEGTKKAMERLAFNYFEGKGHPPLSEENVGELLDHLHKVISGSIKVSKPKKYKN